MIWSLGALLPDPRPMFDYILTQLILLLIDAINPITYPYTANMFVMKLSNKAIVMAQMADESP